MTTYATCFTDLFSSHPLEYRVHFTELLVYRGVEGEAFWGEFLGL